MKLFKRFKVIEPLNELLIDQIKKNTKLMISMYNDNYISNKELLKTIESKLNENETKVTEDTFHIDEVLYNEMICVKELIDIVYDIVPERIHKQYNDIVLISNLMFEKGMSLETIDFTYAT